MNNTFTVEELAIWIRGIKEAARLDDDTDIFWFVPTMNKPFSIVAGWKKMFVDQNYSDIFCSSASRPEYAMCIKVAISQKPFTNATFEDMFPPLCMNGEDDDTCIPLEWGDDPEYAAEFFTHEWERIMESHKEEI